MSYFKPWRRKIGVLTLGLACVFTAGWVRSLRVVNNAAFSIGNRTRIQLISREATFAVRSIHSELPVEPTDDVNRVVLMGWQSRSGDQTGDLALNVDAAPRAEEGSPYRWILNRHEFEIGGVVDKEYPLSVFIFQAPYWSIVIPLTLLSAYLLLRKPRTLKPPGPQRAIIPPTSTGPDKDPAIASALEVAADH